MHKSWIRKGEIAVLSALILFTVVRVGRAQKAYDEDPVLESIILNRDSVIIADTDDSLYINYRYNDLLFDYSCPDTTVMRFMLEGFEDSWSDWTSAGYKEYTNLPTGRYNLRTQYIVKGTIAGEIDPLSFKILPLWYFSAPAFVFYFLFAVMIIWAVYTVMNLRFARTQYMLEQIINKRTEDLIVEKDKTEKLLANVLPKNTASEIMEKGKATKIKYNFVTVLFSDIQGFTKIAEEMNPEVLIDELDKFFFYFDSVVEKLGIEKIKTIGDAYMCAGGIPEKNRTNPVEVILAALEMQVYMARLKESSELEGMKFWDIRIGIHTGTVIAGVVGQKKLSYDIWGDTVNTASRMESSGEGGKINISGTTHEFVKDFFVCEHRGKMPVKYKGELDMYFVNGIKQELRDEEGKPNKKFILKLRLIKIQDIEEAIIKMFDDEAPPDLYFHNSSLVRSICSQTDLLSTSEKLSEEEYINVKLAAIFLYTGYITDYNRPLEASNETVAQTMSKYGFESESIDEVINLIQKAYRDIIETISDKILHDARYDYLGRVDFIRLSDKLLREESEYGHPHGRKEWIGIQRNLLLDHDFKTETAVILRSVQIEEQIANLQVYNE